MPHSAPRLNPASNRVRIILSAGKNERLSPRKPLISAQLKYFRPPSFRRSAMSRITQAANQSSRKVRLIATTRLKPPVENSGVPLRAFSRSKAEASTQSGTSMPKNHAISSTIVAATARHRAIPTHPARWHTFARYIAIFLHSQTVRQSAHPTPPLPRQPVPSHPSIIRRERGLHKQAVCVAITRYRHQGIVNSVFGCFFNRPRAPAQKAAPTSVAEPASQKRRWSLTTAKTKRPATCPITPPMTKRTVHRGKAYVSDGKCEAPTKNDARRRGIANASGIVPSVHSDKNFNCKPPLTSAIKCSSGTDTNETSPVAAEARATRIKNPLGFTMFHIAVRHDAQ